MITTQTIVQNNHPSTVHVFLQQSSAQEFQSALDRLTEILFNFEDWNDPLSQRLFKWSAKVLTINQDIKVGTEVIEKAKERVDKLLNKILINPLDGAPLKHPVLDQDRWVWERWMVEEYLSFSTNSPFVGAPISTIKPHVFAEQMLSWVQSLPLNSNASATSTDLILSRPDGELIPISKTEDSFLPMQRNIDKQLAALKLFTYCQLAQTAVTTQLLRENLRKKAKAASAAAIQVWKESRELIRQETERAQQNATAHEAMIEIRIDGVEQTHHHTVDLLHTQIKATNQQLHNINVQLQNSQSQCTSQAQQIQHFRDLYAQKCQEVEGMGESKKSKSKCTIM